jgi:hypothetical protein
LHDLPDSPRSRGLLNAVGCTPTTENIGLTPGGQCSMRFKGGVCIHRRIEWKLSRIHQRKNEAPVAALFLFSHGANNRKTRSPALSGLFLGSSSLPRSLVFAA